MNEWEAILLVVFGLAGAVRLTFMARARKKRRHIKKVERLLTDALNNGRSR